MNGKSTIATLMLLLLSLSCGGGKHVQSVVKNPVPVDPFKPLPIPAYEGKGEARHKIPSVAKDKAYLQAMSNLASSVWLEVRAEFSEYQGDAEDDPFWTATRKLTTHLPLPGQKFREEYYDPDQKTWYCRVYMSKSEVDQYLMKSLIENSRELAKTIIQGRIQQAQGTGRVEDELQILAKFHRDQRGGRKLNE